jgi:hypothetical protein
MPGVGTFRQETKQSGDAYSRALGTSNRLRKLNHRVPSGKGRDGRGQGIGGDGKERTARQASSGTCSVVSLHMDLRIAAGRVGHMQ